jgi:hypothetical protein
VIHAARARIELIHNLMEFYSEGMGPLKRRRFR